MTSLGGSLASDEMMVESEHEEEELKTQTQIASAALPKLGAEFKRRGKEAIENMILRQRFQDTRDGIVLQHRKADWIKDLNMNLITGKVVRSTHYFDSLDHHKKVLLVKALAHEPGNREHKDCELIEPYVRSMTVFKPYKNFESSDFMPILQELKLHKFSRG